MEHQPFGARFRRIFSSEPRLRSGNRRPRVLNALPGPDVLETRALPATVTVHVFDFDFSTNPSGRPVVDPVIYLGDTVHWVWDDGMHSTTSAGSQAESWNSGVHTPSFSFDHTFTHVGVFAYYCTVHGFDNGNGTAGGMSGTITVLSNATLTSIVVTPANPSLARGETEQFEAIGTLSDGTSQDLTSQVTWASANTSVAAVSDVAGSKGLASALSAGTSTITATLGGITGGTTLSVTDTGPQTPPLVTVTNVAIVLNRRRLVSQVVVSFSGPVSAGEANNATTFRLATAGRRGSFDARNARVIALRSSSLNVPANIVTLSPRRPFALSRPVQLRINGLSPSGLHDPFGRLIDGDHDGQPGGNALALLRKRAVVLSAFPLVRHAQGPAEPGHRTRS